MALILYGRPISPGIAIGQTQIFSQQDLDVVRQDIDPVNLQVEQMRLNAALEKTKWGLVALKKQTSDAPTEMGAIIDVHIMILEDPEYAKGAVEMIRKERCNAEWALVTQMHLMSEKFQAMEDPYLRERGQDFIQITERVLKVLAGHSASVKLPLNEHSEGQAPIIVAHDISPADTLHMRQGQVAAFVIDLGGGSTSHTAIIARNLKIPAISGLHNSRTLLQNQETVIVDGVHGALIVGADQALIDEYAQYRHQYLQGLHKSRIKLLQRARPVTTDGVDISLRANLELPEDASPARREGAEGVGLFRTEFLFLGRERQPDENEQFEAYRLVLQTMQGLPVVIRTLDIGADKSLHGETQHEPNPALGLRAIRYCLAEHRLFLTQLRALLRASHYGQLRILVPMFSHTEQIVKTLALIERAKAELLQQKIPFNRDIAVGAMIEIPAAALMLEPFVHRLDFLSIGTNDLIQYTLAIDRSDDRVAHLYDPLHPAVLWLIEHIINTANKAKVAVAMCGEMAGDSLYTPLLLGMGLKDFSMHSSQIIDVKQKVLQSNFKELRLKIRRLLKNPERLREVLQRLNAAEA